MSNCNELTAEISDPQTITEDSENQATSVGHSHKIEKATQTTAGIVKVVDHVESTDPLEALSANQGRVLADALQEVIHYNKDETINQSLDAALGYLSNRLTASYSTLVLAEASAYKHAEASLIYVVNDAEVSNCGLYTIQGGQLVKAPWDALSSALTSEPFEVLHRIMTLPADTTVEYQGNVYVSLATLGKTIADGQTEISEIIQTLANANRLLSRYILTDSGKTQEEVNNEVATTFAAYIGGRKAYTTLALAQAAQSSLPANTAIEVTNDPTAANNGTYQWNGTALTKSSYDPLTQAKGYTNSTLADGYIKNYTNEALLLDDKPPVLEMRGRVEDTRKIYLWNRTSAEGVIPVTGTWTDTRLSDLDQAIERVQLQLPSAVSNSSNIITITDANGIPTWLAADKDGGVPDSSLQQIQKAQSFSSNKNDGLVFADENGVLYDLGLNSDGTFSNLTKDALSGAIKYSQNDFYLDSNNVIKKLGAIRTKAAIFGSSTMELMQSGIASMLQQSFAFQDILQGGKSGERVEQIANRFGAIPVKLTFANDTINATGATDVSVNFDGLTSMPTASSTLSTTGYVRVNNQNIRGTFSYNSSNSTFRFSRTTSGTAINAPAQYEFISDSTDYSDAALIILNVGKNNVGYGDGQGTAEYIADATLRMFKHIQPLAKKVIVASHFSNTTSSDALLKIVNDTNEYYRKQYGGLYFDMNAYLMSSQVWIDTAISPNSDDLQKQSEGRLPLSLSRDAGSHLSDTANTAVVAKLEQFILDKGWY